MLSHHRCVDSDESQRGSDAADNELRVPCARHLAVVPLKNWPQRHQKLKISLRSVFPCCPMPDRRPVYVGLPGN